MNLSRLERLGTLCGLLAPLVFMGLYLTAISLDPSYVLGASYLSELGVGPAAWAFNAALVVSGILIVLFVVMDLRTLKGSRVARASRTALAISGGGMVGAGVWSMDILVLHAISALIGFAALAVGQALFLTFVARTRAFGSLGTGVTAIALSLSVLMLASGVEPLWETAGALAAFIWLLTIASKEALRSLSHRH